MRILFGFRDAQIAQAGLTHHVGQNVVDRFRRNHDRKREFLVVLGHADVLQILGDAIAGDGGIEIGGAGQVASPLRIQSAVACQSACDLADAVGAEVETDTGIVIADRWPEARRDCRCKRRAR